MNCAALRLALCYLFCGIAPLGAQEAADKPSAEVPEGTLTAESVATWSVQDEQLTLEIEPPEFRFNDGPMDDFFALMADMMIADMQSELELSEEETETFLKLMVLQILAAEEEDLPAIEIDIESMDARAAYALLFSELMSQEMTKEEAGTVTLSYVVDGDELTLVDESGDSVAYRRDGAGEGLLGKWVATAKVEGTEYRDMLEFNDGGSARRIRVASGNLDLDMLMESEDPFFEVDDFDDGDFGEDGPPTPLDGLFGATEGNEDAFPFEMGEGSMSIEMSGTWTAKGGQLDIEITRTDTRFNDEDMEDFFVLVADRMLAAMQAESGLETQELELILKLGMTDMDEDLGFDPEGMEIRDILAQMMSRDFRRETGSIEPENIVLDYILEGDALSITDEDGERTEYRREEAGNGLVGRWLAVDGTEYVEIVEFTEDGTVIRTMTVSGDLNNLMNSGFLAGSGDFDDEDFAEGDFDTRSERGVDFAAPEHNDVGLVGDWSLKYYDEDLEMDVELHLELKPDGSAILHTKDKNTTSKTTFEWATAEGVLGMNFDDSDEMINFSYRLEGGNMMLDNEEESQQWTRLVASIVSPVSWGTLKQKFNAQNSDNSDAALQGQDSLPRIFGGE